MTDHFGTLPAGLAYHDARGNAAWTAAGVDDAKRTAAMVRASQALDALYGARYPGSIASADQISYGRVLMWSGEGRNWPPTSTGAHRKSYIRPRAEGIGRARLSRTRCGCRTAEGADGAQRPKVEGGR